MAEIIEVRAGQDAFKGELIKKGFLPDLSDWYEEGLGHFSMEDDFMVIDAREGGYSAFWTTPLPKDIVVQYTVRSRQPWQQNNFNLISHCSPPNPGQWPIVENGVYKGYRSMPNYIVTYLADCSREEWGKRDDKGRSRVRRDPGFELKQQMAPDCKYGVDYRLTLVVQDGCIHYYLDDEKIHEWQDPEPLDGGYFAFRTYCTVAEYRDLTMAKLVEAELTQKAWVTGVQEVEDVG